MLQQPPGHLVAHSGACRTQRKEDPRNHRHSLDRRTELGHVERQDRTERPVDELQREDHPHQQDEILEGQNASEADSSLRSLFHRRPRGAFVVHDEHEHDGNDVEAGGDEEGVSQAGESSHRTSDDGPERGPEALRGLDDADGVCRPVPGRRLGSHRQRQRSISGKETLEGAQRKDVPGTRHERHRRHDDDEADERPLHHDLPAEAIRQASPEGSEHGRHRRRDAKAQT